MFRDVTVGRLLSELADALPDREALVYADRDLRWTFRDLETEARLIARSDGAPSSRMRPSRVAWAQVSWPACHLTKASASAVM